MHIQFECWGSSTETGGHDEGRGTREVPVNSRSRIGFVLQRVECKSLPGLKRTFGPGLIFFENRLTFRLNHFVSHKNSSPPRQTNCSTTRTLSFPPSSCCFPAKTTAPPALMLPAVTLQIYCALIKQALRY